MFQFRKVLILTQYFRPELGAPQIRLWEFCKELKSQGINVEVLTAMPNYPEGVVHESYKYKIYKKELIEGIPIRRTYIYPAAGRNSILRLINYFSFTITCFLPLIFSRKVDLVFVEAQPIILAIPALILKYIKNIPYIYNTPDLQIEYAEQAKWIKSKRLIRFAKIIESFLMRNSLSTTTVTHSFMRHFSKYRSVDIRKISFFPNGADIDFLKPISRDIVLLKKFKLEKKIVFSYVGTHAPYQGLETILHAAKLLNQRRDIAILMVGKGPERERLKKIAKNMNLENIFFHQSPYSEMDRLMSITYASIITLRDLPIARKMRLSKAVPPLSCGVPVLYSGYGETLDILLNHNAGISVKPENPMDLANKIIYIADHPKKRKTMGQNARTLSLEHFSWKRIVKNWQKQISSIKNGEDPYVEGFI